MDRHSFSSYAEFCNDLRITKNRNRGRKWTSGVYSCERVSSIDSQTILELEDKESMFQLWKLRKRSADRMSDVASHRICIWKRDNEAGDVICDIINNIEVSVFSRDRSVSDYRKQRSCSSLPENKAVVRSKNCNLVLSIQLGIGYAVRKHDSLLRELRISDFDPAKELWTRLPPKGWKFPPPHQSGNFRWKDYCPSVFRQLRKLFAVHSSQYIFSICGSNGLKELYSQGKSGSIFYMTYDDRFMVKTVKKSEVKVLLKMLPSYYRHASMYKNSLLTKFLGLHCVKPIGGPKTRFIVMLNLLCSEYRIHKRFDLKGSSYGRIAHVTGEVDEITTLKDLDLNFNFHLHHTCFEELMNQICIDCKFLLAEGIMDYSFVLGIHFCDDTSNDDGYYLNRAEHVDPIMDGRNPFIRLGANMPAKAECITMTDQSHISVEQSSKFFTHSCGGDGRYEVVLYFGIIDILQDYDITKKLEHIYKSWQVDSYSISVVDPKLYSKRFRDFLHKVFVDDG